MSKLGAFAKFLDQDMLRSAGASALGGGLGGLAYGLAMNEFEFFRKAGDSANVALAKQGGLAVGAALLGGALLWDRGDEARDAAKGLFGVMGGVIVTKLYNRFVQPAVPLSLAQMPSASSRIELNSARVYEQNELPANVGNIRVTETPMTPGVFAALHG